MSATPPSATPLPRAGIDPIDDEATALAMVRLAAARPARHETIVVLLDHCRCGIGLVVVNGTCEPGAVLEVAECLLTPEAHDGRIGAVIVASCRPGGELDLADADRWLELDDLARRHDVELLEWFVEGAGLSRPRELVNAPPRW